MAFVDYRLCDNCQCKVFYDVNLNYEFGKTIPVEDLIRGKSYKLERLGDWAVLCRECAKTHKCEIIPL